MTHCSPLLAGIRPCWVSAARCICSCEGRFCQGNCPVDTNSSKFQAMMMLAAAPCCSAALLGPARRLLQRRSIRSSRPMGLEVVSQARKGLSELLSLTKK